MNTESIGLGDFKLYLICDSTFRLDGGAMFGIIPKVLWQKSAPADSKNRILLTTRCLLIRTPGASILVDTGLGDKYSRKNLDIFGIEKRPGLREALHTIDISPEQITGVILSHLHFDHCGGNTRYSHEGRVIPTFPNAKFYVQRREWEDALNPDRRSKASYVKENFLPVEHQIIFLDGDCEISPGIELMVTGGHTRGHQIVKISSGSHTACFLADLIPTTSHIKIPYVMGYDLFPLDTMVYKDKLLKDALNEDWILIFEHSPTTGAARITWDNGDYRLIPLKC